MIDVNLDVKVDGFNQAMSEMAARLGNSTTKRNIIRNEVRAILQKTTLGVKVAKADRIMKYRSERPWTTMNDKKYLVFGTGRDGHKNRYPDALWGALVAQRDAGIARRIAEIGWGAKSWYELALSLGLPVDGGAAATAVYPGKSAAVYVSASENDAGSSYGIQVTNSSTLQQWIGGRAVFFSAIAGRTGFYRQNLKHGVFSDLAQVAAKYPGLTVFEN